jgi:hypothetical protein
LLADYSPTALLAARGLKIPRILVSSGFGELVPGHPDLCLRPWHPRGRELTATSEKVVVGVVNQVLERRGQELLRQVSEIYHANRLYLFHLPEIDLWESRCGANYLPPPQEPGNLRRAAWPEGSGPRVFAYFKRTSLQTLPTIRRIARLPCVGVIVCVGLSNEEREGLQRPGLRLFQQPLDLAEILDTADVVVCHGGRSTLSDALLAGKPLLLIPEQLEQWHNSNKVEQQGAGILVGRKAGQEQIQDALSRLITSPAFREASRAIALRNAAMKTTDPVAAVLAGCEQALASSPGGTTG